MGCFNTTGFHSKLPIVYGDKIFSIICLRMDAFDDDFLRFSPGYQVTPMFLPIFGEYNDYGNITNIERTPSVESIERIFGDTIENIMRAIQDIMWGQEREVIFVARLRNMWKKLIIHHIIQWIISLCMMK